MKQVIVNIYVWLKQTLALVYCQFLVKPFLVKRPKYDKKYTLSICAPFLNEAPFLTEWIEYHKMLGVDHFYLYNNGSTDNYLEILQPYIDEGIVTLVEYPGRQVQILIYKDFFKKYAHETQWVGLIDIDEFICPISVPSIKQWLLSHDRTPSIIIYWKQFGTSGIIEHDYNKLVMEQYTISRPGLWHWGKCLINTNYSPYKFDQIMHEAVMDLSSKLFMGGVLPYDSNGHAYTAKRTLFKRTNCIDIQINHYFTKAWDVYNAKRTRPDVYHKSNPKADMSYFFAHENKMSEVDCQIFRYILQLKLELSKKATK